jgi:hypothetical protein
MLAVLHTRAAAILPFARQLVNLTFFVFLVLDQRFLRQAISLLEYHDDLPPLLWPSYLLSAILKPALYEHDTTLYSCIQSHQ